MTRRVLCETAEYVIDLGQELQRQIARNERLAARLAKVRQRLRETRARARRWQAKAYACGAPRRKVGA